MVLEIGSIYHDSEFLRKKLKIKIGTDLAKDLSSMPEKLISETEKKVEQQKIIISSAKDTKAGSRSNGGKKPAKERVNEIIPFDVRDKILKEFHPAKIIDILDTNDEGANGNGRCYIYENPSITNNGKANAEKSQEQKGKLFVFEPVNGDKVTKMFFIPEEVLQTGKDINEIIKENLEIPISDFNDRDGTLFLKHTSLQL